MTQGSDLKIFCPSKGRHDRVLTTSLVNDLLLLVPDNEVDAYKEYNPNNEVIGTPSDVKGITATKQWLFDNFDSWFTIDDDVKQVVKMYEKPEKDSAIFDADYITDIIYRLHDMAVQLDAKMFGFTKERNPLMYVSQKPFQFSGYMNSSHFGVIKNHKLFYNLDMNEGEDHWLSCLNAYKNRYFLMDMRYAFFTKDNFMARGGCNDYRTEDDMKKNTILLRKHFGSVVKLKMPGHARKKINLGERSISIPL